MQKSIEKFSLHFPMLNGVQLVALSMEVVGLLGGDVDTNIEISYRANIEQESDSKQRLVVGIQLNSQGKRGNDTIFTSTSRLVGIWNASDKVVFNDEELMVLARDVALPVLYPILRQHVADALGKAGIHVDRWPWDPRAIAQIGAAEPSKGKPARKKK
jgi:hypothetical protein